MPASDLFITGTDTNVGKTVLSALLCAALNRAYWKPIQTGTVEGSDSQSVMAYAGISERYLMREAYRFEPPVSPHLAARMAATRIDLGTIVRPSTVTPLVIEGAGGVLVPINENEMMIDLMKQLGVPILLASRTKLGTINHTLLSIKVLREAGLPLKGVVMIGEANDNNRRAIEHYGETPVVGWIPLLDRLNREALIGVYNRYFRREALA